ncbi:MAG: hypothetical protein JXB39_03715, partial [Deltaproteobacteria bacterium]|nr:hypothetical protein [Deltaproteobacteria bacterium]
MSLLAAAAPIALLSPLAAAWPEDAGWLPLEMDHAPLEEPADDVVGLASEGAQDLVGDAENPSGYWAFDEDSFYFRMRVAASPEDASWAGAWGLVLDTDGSDVSFELALCVASNAASLVVRSPFAAESGLDTPLGPDRLSWDDPCALDVLRIASPTASSGALEDAWVDLALSRADLGSVGVTTRSALRVAMATSLDASCTAFDADGSGRDDTAGVGPVGEYLSDTVGIDTDLDDLDWYGELEAGSNPFLPDTDFDGLLDGVEVHTWGLDPTDADTDGDGLDDGDELQVYNTSPSNPDSDGDGLTDGEEVNVYGTNPNLNDTDQDGIRDGVEVACTLGGPDTDRDSDGISDLHEGDDDTDLDKSPDFCDTDSDGDGIPDADEGEEDVDCDGIPNYKDADDHDHSCGDTAPDSGTDDSGTEPDDTSSPAEDGDGAPCGCGPSGRPGAWIAGLIALGAVLSRRRASVARAAVLLWAVLVAMPDARAQGVDAQNLKPSVDGRAFVVLDDALAGRSGPGGGLLFSWADDPVVWRPETGGEEAVVSALGVIDALAFWNLGAFRVGLDVPFVPVASGDDVSGGHWIGDLSVDARSTILDRRSHRVGLSTSVRVSLPTGSEEAWVGDGTSTFRALVGTSTGRRLVVAANAGLATGAGSDALADPYGLDWGLRALWGAGVRVPLTRAAWVSGELFGESVLGNPDEPGAKPLEGLLSVRLAPHADLLITVGGGSGLSGGVGSPDLRAVAGISWVPTGRAPAGDQADADRDGDGIPDIDDRCPERPGVAAYQGCPAPGAGAG